MSVLVVGSIALDSIETPYGNGNDILGGSASFFSVVASLLTPVRLVGVVGDDFPKQHIDFFNSYNIDLSGLKYETGRTFRWSGRYHQDMVGRVTLSTELNVFEKFSPRLTSEFSQTPYVFLANIHPALQLQVIEQMKDPKFVACDTMNLWINTERALLEKVINKVDLLFINDEEVRLFTNEISLVKAAKSLRAMGPKKIIIKRGDAGAMLFDESGIFWVPAYPLERIIDPTGAGDSFAGGFISYISRIDKFENEYLRQAMVYAATIASFSVEDFSLDRFRNISLDNIIMRSKEFYDLVSFKPIVI